MDSNDEYTMRAGWFDRLSGDIEKDADGVSKGLLKRFEKVFSNGSAECKVEVMVDVLEGFCAIGIEGDLSASLEGVLVYLGEILRDGKGVSGDK